MFESFGARLDDHFKTIKDTPPEFTERYFIYSIMMKSVFEFEIFVRWVPEETEASCSRVLTF
jgi:hypothetical protein